MRQPLVSVVIPTYNYAQFVTEAVDSALAQTYGRFEVLVVDDGSTDDTRQRLAGCMDRIRYIYQENQGLSAARNTGIGAARGGLIALLDSDDLWHPRKLEVQVPHLLENPEAGLVAAQDHIGSPQHWAAIQLPVGAQPVTLEELVVRVRFGPSSVLVRKECFQTVGLFDPTLRSVEDRDMWLRLAARYGILRVDAPLYWYRIHGTNMSRNTRRMEAHERRVLRKNFATLQPLRGRRWLKRKGLSWAWLRAAYGYDLDAQRWRALGRLLGSLWLWPWLLDRQDVTVPFMRLRKLVVIVLRMLRLAAPDRDPAPTPSGAAEEPGRSRGGLGTISTAAALAAVVLAALAIAAAAIAAIG